MYVVRQTNALFTKKFAALNEQKKIRFGNANFTLKHFISTTEMERPKILRHHMKLHEHLFVNSLYFFSYFFLHSISFAWLMQ